jgi:hypothetical protein
MSYTTNNFVEWLLTRSYGQGGTVALPTREQSDASVRGDFPAGVADVLHRLVDRYASWTATQTEGGRGEVEWCFLVGGPGNGKSEALRYLAGALLDGEGRDYVLQPRAAGSPVPRVVPLDWPSKAAHLVPGLEIAFLNDASIPRAEALGNGKPGSLLLDLMDGIERLLRNATPVVLFCNVNRGILIEEQNALSRSATLLQKRSGELAASVIRWLVNPPNVEPSTPSVKDLVGVETLVAIDPMKPFYGQFRLSLAVDGASYDVIVHAVFLDVLSLLEPTPGTPGNAIDFSGSPPHVAPYTPFGSFTDGGADRDRTIAGQLLQDFVAPAKWQHGGCINPTDQQLCDAFQVCPLAQNAHWLQEGKLRQRFLDVLRAAEIAAGRRLTYRDLLGHIALAIIGQPEQAWLTGISPCRWVEEKLKAVDNGIKAAAAGLITHRIYANLFPSPDKRAWKRARSKAKQGDTVYGVAIEGMTSANEAGRVQAFERAFNDIDPARDTESWNGVRSQVLDAIEALDVIPPSSALANLCGNTAKAAESDLEIILDRILRDEIIGELTGSNREATRRANLLRKWRCTLLLRQVGLALGHVAFAPALNAWLAEQENALQGRPSLQLGHGIQALILPPSAGPFLLAPFRPRTFSLTEHRPASSLLVPVSLNDLRVEIVPRGDTLVAEVRVLGAKGVAEVIASLVIDLAVAREAILHTTGDTTAFTEIGESAFARIERARASLIGRTRMKNTTVYFTSASGELYRITTNPAGPAPLRVQKA